MLKSLFIIFASYRLTLLLSSEDGPFDIFKKLRTYLGVIEIEEEQIDNYGIRFTHVKRISDTFFGKLFICPFCLSGYVVPIVLLMPTIVMEWLGYWGIVKFLIEKESAL